MSKFLRIFLWVLLFLYIWINSVKASEILTWDDCIKEAAKNHPDLISASEAIKQQGFSKAVTASDIYPKLDGNLDISRSKTTQAPKNSYSYGVAGSQLIFNGAKTINDIRAASENIKASIENYKFVSSDVRFNLRTAFVNLLKAQEFVNVARDIVKIRRDSLILITLRYQSGLEHKGALLTAEANLSEAEYELSQGKREVELRQVQLSKEMGRKEIAQIYVKGDFEVSENTKSRPDFQVVADKNPSASALIRLHL